MPCLSQTKAQRTTHLKRILQDTKAHSSEDMHQRLIPLGENLSQMLCQLDTVLAPRVFVGVARGLWDRLGRQVLDFLDDRKENVGWFKGSSAGIALQVKISKSKDRVEFNHSEFDSFSILVMVLLQVLENMFTLHLQKLQGNLLVDKDLEPPRSVLEARSMLSMDVAKDVSDSYSFF